jgi:hypothetical protein
MFKMERLNHSRTKVYGDRCALLPVDTFDRADKLKKVENGLKFERFDVFSDFNGAQSAWPTRNGEWERSLAGLARFSWTQGNPSDSPFSFYLPGTPNESPSLVDLLRLPLPPGRDRGVNRRSTRGADSIVRPSADVLQGDSVDFRWRESDAAQALQPDSRTCKGVQDGSITGWEDCSYPQKIAVRQWDEETAQ